jgi:hypothetical protein
MSVKIYRKCVELSGVPFARRLSPWLQRGQRSYIMKREQGASSSSVIKAEAFARAAQRRGALLFTSVFYGCGLEGASGGFLNAFGNLC